MRRDVRAVRRRSAWLAVVGAAVLSLAVTSSASAATKTLTVTKQGNGTGTVTSSPEGIKCPSTCTVSFTEGSTVTLTGVSDSGTEAVKWSGCGSISEGKCVVTMSGAKTVTATFSLEKHQLKVTKAGSGSGTVTSSPSGINCGSTCTASFNHGVTVTLTGIPATKGQGVQWTGCDSIKEGKCVVAMNAARSVVATFDVIVSLKVTTGGTGSGAVTSSPGGIECGATCTAGFAEGSTVTLTGNPDSGIEPAKWIGCDSVTTENKCVVTMSAAREVTAIFNLPSFTLTITKLGNGTGSVTSSPAGIECPSACFEGFVKGSKVTLTGTPGLHTEAVKWAGCDEIAGANECVVTMSAAREVTALFALEPQYVEFTVSVNPKGTGQGSVVSFPPGISCPGDCSQKFVFKTPVTLIATAGSGSEFAHWAGGSCSGTGPCERKINSDRTVNAVFSAVGNRTLTVSKAGSGQGVVTSKPQAIECGNTCSTELDAATKVALHAVATPGSTFAGWSGEGCSGTGPCKVLMNEARNVTATFSKNPSPPEAKCHVPRLKGKSLAGARRALFAAHCSLGKVRKPKGKGGRLVVASSKPGAGTVRPAGARVNLKLTRKR